MFSIEFLTVYLIIGLSVAYLGYRAYQALKGENDPCRNCTGCALKDLKDERKGNKYGKASCEGKKMS